MTNEELIVYTAVARAYGYKAFKIKTGKRYFAGNAFLTEKEADKLGVILGCWDITEMAVVSKKAISFFMDKIDALEEMKAPLDVLKKQVRLLKRLKIELIK